MGNAVPRACQSCRPPGHEEPEASGEEQAKPHLDDDRPLAASAAEDPSPGGPAGEATPAASSRAQPLAESGRWVLPADGCLTVMMFGMTGAGKSSLGNLIAGSPVFEAADDTASVTNLDSVMRYEAPDQSLVLLDTIGLGDTDIDQDKVVASIRDVALSAPCGIDVLLFVMRHARITDDAIARLIYVTEYLWGQECLLNLYIVVTFASRYLIRKDEAMQWIERQAEINWRFAHIYNLVGNNPHRFIFIDNPDLNSEEPNIPQRQAASQAAIMKTLVLHPRDVVPPFTHAIMKKARQLSEVEVMELELRQKEVQDLGNNSEKGSTVPSETVPSETKPKEQEQDSAASSVSPAPSAGPASSASTAASSPQAPKTKKKEKRPSQNATGGGKGPKSSSRSGSKDGPKTSPRAGKDTGSDVEATVAELREKRARAREKREAAERALRRRLEEVRTNKEFQESVVKEAERATAKFVQAYGAAPDPEPSKSAANGSPVVACKRMLGSLSKSIGRMSITKLQMSPRSSLAEDSKVERVTGDGDEPHTSEANETNLDSIVDKLANVLRGGVRDHFERWAGSSAATLSPVTFQTFLSEVDPSIKKHQAGGLWRRGDANCDGQMDFAEFNALFSGNNFAKTKVSA